MTSINVGACNIAVKVRKHEKNKYEHTHTHVRSYEIKYHVKNSCLVVHKILFLNMLLQPSYRDYVSNVVTEHPKFYPCFPIFL